MYAQIHDPAHPRGSGHPGTGPSSGDSRKTSRKSHKTSLGPQHHYGHSHGGGNTGDNSSSIFGSRYVQNLLESQPISIESKKSSNESSAAIQLNPNNLPKYRVVQRLLPDVSLARHIVDSDDHAFASLDECCHDLNNNTAPKMSAERRRDHLHLMRRRKSRARLLTIAEIVKLQHFRKFLQRAGIGPHGLIRRVLDIRRHELLHAYDENGVPAAKDGIR